MFLKPVRLLAALALLVTCGVFAACGEDDEPAAAAPASAGQEPASGFPVTVTNQLGEVEITERPERVVALDHSSADAAIALGVIPVAMAKVDYAPGGVQPWTKAALAGKEQPELLTLTDGIPLEEIAAQRPDLIVAANTYGLGDVYDKLSQIAPVVGWETAEGADSWQSITERVGASLGRADEAAQLVADVESQVREVAGANPEFDGKTISFFNYVAPDAWVINTPKDFSIQFLAELGFSLTPEVAAMKGAEGRAQVSRERLDAIEADVVMGTSPDAESLEQLQANRIFQRQDFAQRRAFVSVDLVTSTSMAFPSVLSVPYGLENIVPKLAEAVA